MSYSSRRIIDFCVPPETWRGPKAVCWLLLMSLFLSSFCCGQNLRFFLLFFFLAWGSEHCESEQVLRLLKKNGGSMYRDGEKTPAMADTSRVGVSFEHSSDTSLCRRSEILLIPGCSSLLHLLWAKWESERGQKINYGIVCLPLAWLPPFLSVDNAPLLPVGTNTHRVKKHTASSYSAEEGDSVQ